MNEWVDSLIKSGTGAIIGYILAQFTNVAYLCWKRYKKPKFRIEKINGTYKVFDGYEEEEHWNDPEALQHTFYAFRLRNTGKSVARNVRAQIVKLEVKQTGRKHFGEVSQGVGDLYEFTGPKSAVENSTFTLAPKASVDIHFAGTREDLEPTIFPAAIRTKEHYELIEYGAIYKFAIVVFDDDGNYTPTTIILNSTKD